MTAVTAAAAAAAVHRLVGTQHVAQSVVLSHSWEREGMDGQPETVLLQ
jgi:hypothetical protein